MELENGMFYPNFMKSSMDITVFTSHKQYFFFEDYWITCSFNFVAFLLQVYDVTKFLEDHPGGDDVLISSTGKFPINHT
jgi:Cytochrome b5-like Heme/Steroid binding domain